MLLNGNMDIIFIHIYLRNMVYDVKLAVKLKKLKSSFLYRIFPLRQQSCVCGFNILPIVSSWKVFHDQHVQKQSLVNVLQNKCP